MDMETDSEDEEDGQISKYEEEEEKDRKRFGKTEPDDEPITLDDLNKCRLTRTLLAKHCMAPWFEDFVKGMFCSTAQLTTFCLPAQRGVGTISHWRRKWPTCLPHMRDNQCVVSLTLCAIVVEIFEDLGVDFVKPYKIDDKTVNQTFDLKHGKSVRSFLMDKVSNSLFLPVGAQFSLSSRVSECTAERV